MTEDFLTTGSVWTNTQNVPTFRPLKESPTCDVCVIGAGITGLSVAYFLARAGYDVVVIDDGGAQSGETARTTAHLTNVIDTRYSELERLHGKEGAKLIYESHTAAIEQIAWIVESEQIDCNFKRVDGFLFGTDDSDSAKLRKEYDACVRAGFTDIEYFEAFDGIGAENRSVIRFGRQAQFHILKYYNGLLRACGALGCRIFADTRCTSVEGERVLTNTRHVVNAKHVIIATNSPITDLVAMHTKQAAYRSYVVGMSVPEGSINDALYWDTEDPYHYVRLEGDVLMIGGEDHKTGQASDFERRVGALEDWARATFPIVGEVAYRWSGQLYEPVDGIAFIGKDLEAKGNVYIATGFSGNGMTYATVAAMLLTDVLSGRANPWEKLYEPSRKPVTAPIAFVKETVSSVVHYADYLKPSEVLSPGQLAPGEGAVMNINGEKVAVYRDHNGAIHQKSAMCPHLKGVVCWNGFEQSWDCPVHGSRFDADGKVIDGPANSDLPEPRHKKAM